MAILATVFLLAVNSMLVVCGAQAPARSPPSAPSCSCSDPVVVSNNLLALAHADKPVTLGQQCTTCNGAFQGAWFKINRSSTARLILLDVCKANQGRPSMLMDVYSASNSSTINACNASQLAHVASFRVAFGDSTACQIRFLAQAYTIYFVRGWFNASQPLPIPLKCGPALLSLTRQPTKPQAASCRKPIMVDMSAWRPSLTSNVQPMFTYGLGTSTCGKPANESSWAGLRGERDVTYRLKGAHRNMTLTIVVRAEPGHNQGNSPYYTPIIRAFTWRAGQCDSNRTHLAAALIGQDVTQYLSENDNGVTSVLQLTVLPKMVTALVVTSIGGYDELCGRGAVDIWAENGPHKFIVKGTPSDRKK